MPFQIQGQSLTFKYYFDNIITVLKCSNIIWDGLLPVNIKVIISINIYLLSIQLF